MSVVGYAGEAPWNVETAGMVVWAVISILRRLGREDKEFKASQTLSQKKKKLRIKRKRKRKMGRKGRREKKR